MCWSSGMASSPMRRVSCPSRSLSLVCKIPVLLLGLSEAIRKPTSNLVPLSSRLLAVMKGRTIAWGEPIQHKLNIADLDHRRTRFDTALIVLTVAPIPPIPCVRTLNDPAFLQWREASHALWTRLHLYAPTGPMLG